MYLYPQIPRSVAALLAEDLRGVPVTQIAELRAGNTHDQSFYTATGGTPVPQERLGALENAVFELAKQHGYPKSPVETKLPPFDVSTATLLLDTLEVTASEASHEGVWNFLSCVLMPHIVRWRFPGEDLQHGNGTPPERFLSGRRNTFERLWWRAYLLRDPNAQGDDRDHLLDQLGEDEVVQIMERPNLDGRPRLARQTAIEFLSALERHRGVGRRDLIRDAQKRLRRLAAFLEFDALDDRELERAVREAFEESCHHLSKARDTGAPPRRRRRRKRRS